MKTLLALVAFTAFQVAASDLLDLRSHIATFTNLQGQAFSNVTLIRADLDGVLWRKEASGGRVCYTNLDLGLLELWGIPTNRAEIASRARRKDRGSAFEVFGRASCRSRNGSAKP
jgi:hypothetical protein